MRVYSEGPFLIGNLKSWIHCLISETDVISDYTDVYHYHDYIELIYGLSDGAWVWINGEHYELKKNELFIINSNVIHSFTFESEARYVCIKFIPQILSAEEPAFFEMKYVLPFLSEDTQFTVIHKDQIPGLDIHKLIFEIYDEWCTREYGCELAMRAAVLKLFAGIFRYWKRSSMLADAQTMNEGIKKALLYISEHYADVTAKKAAEISNLSYNYFSSTFKKCMNMSFSEYVTLQKVRAAEKLLLTTDESVTDVAMMTGFPTTSHFIYQFKKIKQITPKQFRNKVLNPPV